MQEVKTLSCWSRFATRCLKLRGTVPKSHAQVKLPGQDLKDEELVGEGQELWQKSYPFSDTEEEVAAMDPEHRALHADVKEMAGGKHINYDEFEFLYSSSTQDGEHYYSASEVIGKCFKAAVEKLLPGRSNDFQLCVETDGGAWGDCDDGAHRHIAYIAYTSMTIDAGGEIEEYRGHVNVPWGHKLSAVPALSDAERARVDAAFALLVERLGLEPVGEPGLKLVTGAGGS